MSDKYDPYILDGQSITVDFPPSRYRIVQQVDLTQDSIDKIADAVVRKLKAEEAK